MEKTKKKSKVLDIGVIDRNWYYSSNPRLEGLFQLLPYIKWQNTSNEEIRQANILRQIEKNKNKLGGIENAR